MSANDATPPSKGPAPCRIEDALVARIGATRFQLWFGSHAVFLPSSREIRIGVSSGQFQDWLEHTFGEAIRAAAVDVYGTDVPVRFVVDPALAGHQESSATNPPAASEVKKTLPRETPQLTLFGDPELPPPVRTRKSPSRTKRTGEGGTRSSRRWKNLVDFVVGASNRVAHASALSVVEEPAQGANPLVIHGPVGTGKTHLLEGIYAGLRRRWPEMRPCFVTGDEFIARFVQSARFSKQSSFRKYFRDSSALLLDDLHVLATAPASQKEFLYTFDALVADGRQVVVTMDCHPRMAEELMPELADRLLGGAVWSVLPPDDETRLGILRARSVGSIRFPEEALAYLARHLRGNVRELEGAINSVRHFAQVTGRPVDASLVREAVGDLLRHTVRVLTIGDVDRAVCRVLNLSAGTLQSKARSWAVCHPRMLAVFLARKHTSATYTEIALHFAAKTHSTAVASEKKVRAWLAKDEPLPLGDRVWQARDLVERIERELQR